MPFAHKASAPQSTRLRGSANALNRGEYPFPSGFEALETGPKRAFERRAPALIAQGCGRRDEQKMNLE